MDFYSKLLVILGAILISSSAVCAGTNATRAFGQYGFQTNINTTGICEIEVPIASILPPELRHTANSIRGNGSTPAFSKIRMCCSGYKLATHTQFYCVPDCPNGCGLGNCTAPNICTCNKGAGIGPDGKCINVCPKGCLNGECYGNFCNCNAGFTPHASGAYCIGGCARNCGPGGQCVGNNQCKCQPGFTLSPQGSCQMVCDKGYKQVGNACEPVCIGGCLNGECIAPGRCNCLPGYTLERNGTCSPKCSFPCYNGICSAPNVCTCKQGYVIDANDARRNRCIPYCAMGCPNGVCSAPNFCICKQGYIKQSKGSNVCIKRY